MSSYVQETYKKCRDNIDASLADLNTHDNLAVAVSKLHANNCPLIASHQLSCLQNENIINFPIAMVVRKDLYVLSKMNEFLQQAIEAGLVDKWKKGFRMYEYKPTKSHEPVVLKMEHCIGSAIFLIGGLIIASLTFCAEHCIHSYMITKLYDRKKPCWWTIERCFCIPERVYCIHK